VVAGLLAILVATLSPGGDGAIDSFSACIFCGDRALADVLINIVLYVPFGLGAALLGAQRRKAILAGALLSATIELVQIWLPGRDASVGDVLANTLGTAIGTYVFDAAPIWLNPASRLASRLAVGWSLGSAALWWSTGALLSPSLPHTSYYGQWTPNLAQLERYRGKVLSAEVGGLQVPPWEVEDSEALRQRLLEEKPITVRFVAGPSTSNLSSIFSVYDEFQREVILFGPDGGDLVFRYRTRAADMLLDQTDIRLVGAARELIQGDTISVIVKRLGRGWEIDTGRNPVHPLGLTVGRGWALLLYAETLPAWARQALDLLWLAGLLFPIGLWMRPGVAGALALGACVTAGLLVPAVSVLIATPPPEWGAMMLGIGAGVAVRRFTLRG
jgi:hypothetical protein